MTAAYTVRAGDTLSHIARKHNATVTGLLDINPEVQDPNVIQVGQKLKLPANDARAFSSAPATCVSGSSACEETYVEIVHVSGTDELFFLTHEDLDEILEEESLICSGIVQLYQDLERQECLAPVKEEQTLPNDAEGALRSDLQKQKQSVVEDLTSLGIVSTDMDTTTPLTEIKRLKGSKHFSYVRSDKIKNHWRSYKMSAKDRDRSKGWLSPEGLDTEKLREAVESDFGIKFNVDFWKLDPESDFSKSLNQFHDEVKWSIWGSQIEAKKNRDQTGFDASAEAQFMRFAAGAGASSEFTPSEGKVHLQAQAQAQFSLAEGKATIEQAYPANNDSEVRIYYRKGGFNGPRAYETMGHFQARLSITASGFAGASALLAGNVEVDCSEGVPTIRGVASAPEGSGEGVDVSATAFAGVRAGCELLGGLYWADKLTLQSDWKTLCKIGQKVEGAAGAGAEAYLKLAFSPDTGKFFVRAHAGLVFGLGASGSFLFEVNANDVASMMRFVYNGLLKTDMRYLEIFEDATNTFDQYVRLSVFALAKGLDFAGAATQFASSRVESTQAYIQEFIDTQRNALALEEESLELARNVLEDLARQENSVFRHSPPEVKGPILNKLMFDFSWSPQWYDGTPTKVAAVGKILESFQSWRDFEETMLRMNSEGRAQSGFCDTNARRVFHYIALNQNDYRLFKRVLEGKTALADRPVQLDPFGACRSCGVVKR